jgi:hypothetical protein
MVQMLKVPQLAWYGSRELELPLADGWQVEMGCMAGHDRLALTSDQIRDAVTGNLMARKTWSSSLTT